MSDRHHRNRIYLTFNYPNAVSGSKTLLTGIRGEDDGEILYITGFYEPPSGKTISFLYKGDITGVTGPCSDNSWNLLNYPSSPGVTVNATNLYSPFVVDDCPNIVRVVGNYTTVEAGTQTFGCMYEGPLDGSGRWITLKPTLDTINVIAHSTHGDLVVGNYTTGVGFGRAFIYDVNTHKYHDIIKPEAKSITAYGIWNNGCNSYTICGGFSNLTPGAGIKDSAVDRTEFDLVAGVDAGYLVDWNNKTHKLSNWREYRYNNQKAAITHFDGITSDERGGYNLTGDATVLPQGNIAFFANVNRHDVAKWEQIQFPESVATSGNSVYQNTVIGVYTDSDSVGPAVNGYISLVI